MARMSEAEKQKSYERILDAAASTFRKNGVETTSVADIMKTAGLTHGGFYRHFSSKDDLVASAFKHAVDDVLTDLETMSVSKPTEARDKYIETYLSPDHVEDRGGGCPLAALSSEVSRSDGGTRNEAADAINRVTNLLADQDHGSEGQAILALLVGTVVLSRLTNTEAESEAMLDAGRTAVNLLQQNWPTQKS